MVGMGGQKVLEIIYQNAMGRVERVSAILDEFHDDVSLRQMSCEPVVQKNKDREVFGFYCTRSW